VAQGVLLVRAQLLLAGVALAVQLQAQQERLGRPAAQLGVAAVVVVVLGVLLLLAALVAQADLPEVVVAAAALD
jgi:hypothetical protein